MSLPTSRFAHLLTSGVMLAVLTTTSGCSMFKLPASLPLGSALPFSGTADKTEYVSDEGMPLRPSEGAMMYQKVRQAKAQNSIVLEIEGFDEPLRVLPLPAEGQSVFVSDLLKQSGVQQKFKRVDATLYRDSPGMPSGVKMAVKMTPDKEQVRPESDYSLRSGDRLVVRKAAAPQLHGLMHSLLGI